MAQRIEELKRRIPAARKDGSLFFHNRCFSWFLKDLNSISVILCCHQPGFGLEWLYKVMQCQDCKSRGMALFPFEETNYDINLFRQSIPLLKEDCSVEFLAPVYTWTITGAVVRIMRGNTILQYHLALQNGEQRQGTIYTDNTISLESWIFFYKHCRPVIRADGTVDLVQDTTSTTSEFDTSIEVNRDLWAITLADNGARTSDPWTQWGHAVLYLEGLEENRQENVEVKGD